MAWIGPFVDALGRLVSTVAAPLLFWWFGRRDAKGRRAQRAAAAKDRQLSESLRRPLGRDDLVRRLHDEGL